MKKHLLLTAVTAFILSFSASAQCLASFTWAQTQPNQVVFTDASIPPNPNATWYLWDFGDNQQGWGPNQQTHVYTVPGVYVVCLSITDSLTQLNCSYCDTVTVTGSVICNLYAQVQQVSSATCSTCPDGSAAVATWNGTAPFSYQWSTGATTPSISGLAPGIYTCCVTDANGCTACDSLNISWANASSCAITFTSSVTGSYAFFNATTSNTNANPGVVWDFGDMTYGYGASVWHMYSQSGTYAVCATVTDSLTQCTSTYCDSVQVTIVPVNCSANFVVQMDSVNTNQAWIYNLSTGSSTMTYQWLWGDNTSDTTAYPAHVYQNTGSYNVCLIVVDQATSCTDTMCQLLWVPRLTQQASQAPFYVNVVVPLSMGITLPGVTAELWTLYPNPANEVLNVTGIISGNETYMITDLAGRTVAAGRFNSNVIDITSLSSGTFIFTLVKENGESESKRFIRQ